jgi:Protein of unknown function (DUF3187)
MKRRYGPALGFVNPGVSCHMPPLVLALAILLFAPAAGLAQGLPAYRPINPVAASRSGLAFEPFRVPVPGRWQADLGLEYASTIESNENSNASFLLDSELFRARATVYHDLSRSAFLLAEAELLGAYAGVLDGFLEWYHDLLGIEIPERERRPKNDFHYAADLADRSLVLRRPGDLFLGDLRLGMGFRPYPWFQSVLALYLPTNSGPPGYGRDSCSRPAWPQDIRRRRDRWHRSSGSSSPPATPGSGGACGDVSRCSETSSCTVPIITTPALPLSTSGTYRWISVGSWLASTGESCGSG